MKELMGMPLDREAVKDHFIVPSTGTYRGHVYLPGVKDICSLSQAVESALLNSRWFRRAVDNVKVPDDDAEEGYSSLNILNPSRLRTGNLKMRLALFDENTRTHIHSLDGVSVIDKGCRPINAQAFQVYVSH